MVIHCGAGMSSKVTYMWLQDPHVEKSLVHHRAEEAESTNRLHRFPGKSLNLTELPKKQSLLIIALLSKIYLNVILILICPRLFYIISQKSIRKTGSEKID